MDKTLLLIRHGKSDWGDIELSDIKRPLNARGESNAPEMAKRLVKRELIPQQLISSPALRAITTARYFATEFNIDPADIIQNKKIYDSLTMGLLEVVNELDESSDFTALIGHNPSLTGLVNYFCGNVTYHMPTCGMALIKFPVDKWELLSMGNGELIFIDSPKNESI